MIAKLLKILKSILALFQVPFNPFSTILVMSLYFSQILFMLLKGFEQNGIFVLCVFYVLLLLCWFCGFFLVF